MEGSYFCLSFFLEHQFILDIDICTNLPLGDAMFFVIYTIKIITDLKPDVSVSLKSDYMNTESQKKPNDFRHWFGSFIIPFSGGQQVFRIKQIFKRW